MIFLWSYIIMIYAFPANQWRLFCKRHSASLIFIMIAQLRGLHLRNASRLRFAVALSFPLLRLSMSSTCRWALCVWVCCENVYNRFTTTVIVLQRLLTICLIKTVNLLDNKCPNNASSNHLVSYSCLSLLWKAEVVDQQHSIQTL